MPFYDRHHEREDIRAVLSSPRPELIIVYGRRGVGKSALLAEALRGHPQLYYQATTRSLPQQLEDLTAALRAFAPELILPGVLPSIDALLEATTQLARSRSSVPCVLVIDELPYLAQADPAVPTVLQRWWDEVRRGGLPNLKVFLLGSLMSWMEEHTLSERGPLHNRRTGQMKLEPLDFADAALFYPRYPAAERIQAYAIWGGMPSYLEEIDLNRDLWENVRESVLRPGARLAEEPIWFRFADLRNDVVYGSILRAIALGDRRPSKIAQAIGKSRADEIAFHLDRLRDLSLVQRRVPIHQTQQLRSHQALYVLADNYVAFWYRYVDRLRHLLGVRRYEEALHEIQADFDYYVSESAFEEICRQFLWRAFAASLLPPDLHFDTVGSWWGSGGDEPDEIDVVAVHEGRAVLFGECKWSRQPVGLRELGGIRAAINRASRDLDPIDRPWRALFSRSGFTADLAAAAQDPAERLLLFAPEDLYR